MSPVSRAERAALHRRLLAWWDAGHRELPWRYPQHAADPYRVWLAEVMLQQTQVAAAIPYYRRFVARWPTLEALAAAPDAEVHAAWSGLGYYARCRNLLAAARGALTRHGGLPASLDGLRALPGFGPYTAGAVASIAFAIPAAAVDGNVTRVLARLFLVDGVPSAPASRARVAAIAEALVHPTRPGDWNQALMELGATVCGKPAPACLRCPVSPRCAARRAGRERAVPPARPRAAQRTLRWACAAVEQEGGVLLVTRPPGGLFSGLRAFPSVEVEDGEDARAALGRTLARLLGTRVQVGEPLASVERVLTHRRLTLTLHRAAVLGRPRLPAGADFAPLAALETAGLPAAMRGLGEALRDQPAPSGRISGNSSLPSAVRGRRRGPLSSAGQDAARSSSRDQESA